MRAWRVQNTSEVDSLGVGDPVPRNIFAKDLESFLKPERAVLTSNSSGEGSSLPSLGHDSPGGGTQAQISSNSS